MPKRLPRAVLSKEGVDLWCGDCVEVMRGLPASSVDLVFADPPFNIGYRYDTYSDSREEDEYLAWCLTWLRECARLMQENASLYLAIGPRYQAEVKRMCHEAGLYWRNTIIWHYTFGVNQRTNWVPSWTAIHYFTKHPRRFTWNDEPIRVPSARTLKYNDKRANPIGKIPDNVWVLLPEHERSTNTALGATIFPSESNTWLESRICGTFKDRVGHPCQMPVPILERIVRASSNEGDRVLDPFLGSGTTAVACRNLGRKCWGIELSPGYCTLAIDRLGRHFEPT